MKLQFKKQPFQLDAVSAIADIFQGQPKQTGIKYMADPGRQKSDEVDLGRFHTAPKVFSLILYFFYHRRMLPDGRSDHDIRAGSTSPC